MSDGPKRLALAFARAATRSSPTKLCDTCVEFLLVAGAGITVMSGGQDGPVCVSDASIGALEDLQFSAGQGPCRDAFASGRWVHTPRLDDAASGKWPLFVSLAVASGFGSVFSYPLVSCGAKIGAMTLYATTVGELTSAQHHDSVELTDVITETLLGLQGEAPAGKLAPAFERAVTYRAQVYQAAGMTAVQLSISASDALLRIRAYAFANDQTIAQTAALIVERLVRLPDDQPERKR